MKKLIAALVLFMCCNAHAANYFRFENGSISSTWYGTYSARALNFPTSSAICSDAISKFETWWNSNTTSGNYGLATDCASTPSSSEPTGTGQSYACSIHYTYYNSSGVQQTPVNSSCGSWSSYAYTSTCTAGSSKTVAYSGTLTNGETKCGADHCQYTINGGVRNILMAGGMKNIATATQTGNACNVAQTTANTYQNGNSDNCWLQEDGSTTCAINTTTNCGTVNGESVCLNSVPTGSCTTTGSGAVVCGYAAHNSTPPAPNNGTSTSTPADPTATLDDSAGPTGNTTYYYSSTVVNNQAGSGSSSSSSSSGGGSSSASSASSYCSTSDCSEVGDPVHDTSDFEEYNAGKVWGDDEGGSATTQWTGKVQSFMSTMKNTLPFSLLASPVVALSTGTPAAPSGSFHLSGHAINWSLQGFNDVFMWVRAAEGLLLVFGFYMVMLATVRNWSK